MIAIGRVSGAHGIKGEIKLFHDSGDPERISGIKELRLRAPGASEDRVFAVVSMRYRGKTPVLSLSGVGERSTAEALTGCEVLVTPDQLSPLSPDEYLVGELIGMTVYDCGRELGQVAGILDNPAHDILRVGAKAGTGHGNEAGTGEILIPLVDVFIESIDEAARRIDVKLPEGMA